MHYQKGDFCGRCTSEFMAFGQSGQKSHTLPMDDDDYFFTNYAQASKRESN